MKKSEYYKDILKYIEARLDLISTIEAAKEIKEHYRKELYLHMIQQRQDEITKWLNEEIDERKSNSIGR